MTDNYDLEDHEHDHAAEGAHEHEASEDHGSKVESWQDDQPPVDDLLEDNATVSEEGTEDDGAGETGGTGKKSILLPVTIGIGAVLVIGAVLHWQFSRAPSHIAAVPSPKPLAAETASVMPKLSPAAEPAVAPKTAMNDNALAAPISPTSGTAMPMNPSNAPASALVAPSAGPSPVVPVPTPTPVPPVVQAAPPLAFEPSAPVVAAVPSKPLPSPTMAPAETSSAIVSHNSAVHDAEMDARITNLSVRIDELKKSLDKATEQLAQAQAQVQSQAGVVLNAPSAGPQLDERLSKVEQQVAQLEHAKKPVAQASLPPEPDTVSAEAAPPVVHHKTASAAHKTHKVASKTSPPPVKHTAKASSNWVLRAATPNEAWIAKDTTTPELRHIQIGDDVPGIGHVKAIQQDGDSWAVVGATGTIH